MLLSRLSGIVLFVLTCCNAEKGYTSQATKTDGIAKSNVSVSDKTGLPTAQITSVPSRENTLFIHANGKVFYNNASFATECGYNDTRCASICSWHHDACSRTWAAWTRTGLKRSMNSDAFTTETQSFHEITQSLKVVSGYTYAMGPEITTKSGTKTISFWAPQLEIVSTLVPKPSCITPSFTCSQRSWCNKNACTVQGGTVELLFWPSTSVNSSFGHDRATSTAGGAVTAVYKNATLTTPSVYLEYKTAYALDGCSNTVGNTYPGAILALDPDDLFSINARNDYFIVTTTIKDELVTTSFYESRKLNYDHLTGLPPGPAYQAMPVCVASGCRIITPSRFHPQLVVPTHIREMDPAWATCDLDWRGSWDPPIALSEAKSIAVPTTAGAPTQTELAAPKPTIESPAKMTASTNTAESALYSSSGTASPESQQSTGSESTGRMFTYSPESPPYATARPTELTDTSTASLVQITTIVQVDPQPGATQEEHGPNSSGLPDPGQLRDGNDGQGNENNHEPDQSSATNGSPSSAATTAPQPHFPYDSQPNLPTTLLPNGDPMTLNSTIYTAFSSSNLLIISAIPPSHSPTNAYEVLSAALSSPTPTLITLTADNSSSIVVTGSQTIHLGSGARTTSSQQGGTSAPENRTVTSTVTRLQSLPSVETGGDGGGALPSVTSESGELGNEGGGEGERSGADDASGAGRVAGKLVLVVFWACVLGLGFGLG